MTDNQKRQPLDNLCDIVNLERYPIIDLDAEEGRNLVTHCRQQFTDSVSCLLPEFLLPDAVNTILETVEGKANQAHLCDRYRSPYGVYNPVHDETVALAEDAPHSTPQRRSVHYLAYDEFSEQSMLHRLYGSPLLARFAAAVLGVPVIHPVADPLMAAPVTLHYQGSELGWHCDTQEFTITVMFRPSDKGGEFQYFPMAGPKDENFQRVPDVLGGNHDAVRNVQFDAGSILLFRGANTLHRVTPTESIKPRVLSVFHYERTPGRMFDSDWKQVVFGRVA